MKDLYYRSFTCQLITIFFPPGSWWWAWSFTILAATTTWRSGTVTASTRALLVGSAGTTDQPRSRAPGPVCTCCSCLMVTRTLTASLQLSRRSQASQTVPPLKHCQQGSSRQFNHKYFLLKISPFCFVRSYSICRDMSSWQRDLL